MMKTYYLITLYTTFVFGGAVITGSAIMNDKAKEDTPSIDLWLIKGRQIGVETNGQVMLRRNVNVVITNHTAESIDKTLDRVKRMENDFSTVALSPPESAEGNRVSLDLDEAKGRTGQFILNRTDRAKLLIILSMYLHSRTPLGHG
jgi:hypothetical protein